MSLCEIPTKDPENPACVDPAVIAFVLSSEEGVDLCDRYAGRFVSIKTKLTTRKVVALLEAASPYSEREATLIAGLRRIAGEHGPRTQGGCGICARSALFDAGVADAEPEKGTQT